jgi:hypothetical protein
MSGFKLLEKFIKKYGSKAMVEFDGKQTETYGVIIPIKNRKLTFDISAEEIGTLYEKGAEYIGLPVDGDILKPHSHIRVGETFYEVVRSEKIMISSKIFYIWAVVRQKEEE